jgi:hypothetical protein
MFFIKQVLSGKKHLINKKDIIQLDVPKGTEFTVNRVYEKFKEDAKVLSHLPDLKKGRKLPDRNWLMTVVSSLKPHLIKTLVNHAENLRVQEKIPRSNDAEIEISAEYLQLLQEVPYLAGKLRLP